MAGKVFKEEIILENMKKGMIFMPFGLVFLTLLFAYSNVTLRVEKIDSAELSLEPLSSSVCGIVFPQESWETRTSDELGLNDTLINQFASNIGGAGVIVKDGYIVKQWNSASKNDWASAAKPVTSTMLFFAIEEGKLNGVDSLIANLGWNLIDKDKDMTFRHLANMMSGYTLNEMPGERWGYNDYAINLYTKTLFDKVYQETADNAARNINRLGILGFQDGALYSSRNGYGVSTSPRDFARIGWFWLNRGNWNCNQVLPKSYFDNYMKPSVAPEVLRTSGSHSSGDYLGVGTYGGGNDQVQYGSGIYGFNWWFNPGKSVWPDAPADLIMASGHWNKEIMVVIPSLNMVVAARGNWGSFEPGSASAGMNTNLKILADSLAIPKGEITVNPENSRWLAYNKDENLDGKLDDFFMCGPGDPEGFLYRGTRNSNGTRNGDQTALIDKLKGTGANSVYLMAVRSHGGDGGPSENPFIDSNAANALDEDILNQWETWFNEMDQNNITIFFIFYDDNVKVSSLLGWTLDASGNLHSQERYFIETIVNRFKHHKNLIWVVAEEVEEIGSDYIAHTKKIAETIRNEDKIHAIAVHKWSGLAFNEEFSNDINIDQFAIQYNKESYQEIHQGVVTAWNNANGRYNLNLAEAANHGSGATARKKNWAIATGGAYAMVLGWDIASTSVADLQDCGRLVNFMQARDLTNMAPHDELVISGEAYILAALGQEYVAYFPNGGSASISLADSSNTFAVQWFNPRNGIYQKAGNAYGGGIRQFSAPDSNDWVLLLNLSTFVESNLIYVDNVLGDNIAGDGSFDKPYKTIQKGVDNALPGKIVIARGDVNKERVYNENLAFSTSGDETARILLKSYSGEKAVINHSNTISINKNYISIEGLIFDHANIASDAIVISGTGIVIRNSEIRNGQRDGIEISKGTSNLVIENSKIHDFKIIPQADAHCIVTNLDFSNIKIINNTIYDCSGDGIQAYATDATSPTSASNGILIQGNEFYSTLGVNAENALDFKDGSNIIIRGNVIHGFTSNKAVVFQKYHNGVIFEENVIYNSDRGIEFRGEPTGIFQYNISVLRNLIYDINISSAGYALKFDGVNDLKAYHNTIFNSPYLSIRIEGNGVNNGDIRNNLVVDSGAASQSGTSSITFSNNGFFNSNAGFLASSSNILGIDPLFSGASSKNFSLKVGSVVIDKGIDLGFAFNGVAPDLGAFEFLGSGCMLSEEICDGIDNDCDGLIDEGLSCGNIPVSPSNLIVSLVDGIVSLAWNDDSNDETEFVIERSVDGLTWEEIGRVGANIGNWEDSEVSLSPGYGLMESIKNFFRRIFT